MEKFLFKINGVEQINNYNGLDNVVVAVDWNYYIFSTTSESSKSRGLSGTTILDMPDSSDNFVPISMVNADVIIEWLTNILDVPAMQERLRFLISQDLVPTYTSMIDGLNFLNNPE